MMMWGIFLLKALLFSEACFEFLIFKFTLAGGRYPVKPGRIHLSVLPCSHSSSESYFLNTACRAAGVRSGIAWISWIRRKMFAVMTSKYLVGPGLGFQ